MCIYPQLMAFAQEMMIKTFDFGVFESQTSPHGKWGPLTRARVFGIYTCDEVGWWLYPRTPVAQGGKTCFELGLGAGSSRLHGREVSGPMCISDASGSDVRLFELGET